MEKQLLSVLYEKPIFMMTGREFLLLTQPQQSHEVTPEATSKEKRLVYGLLGLQKLLGCSHTIASKIKQSGKINGCFSQIGRKIVFDADAVLLTLNKETNEQRAKE